MIGKTSSSYEYEGSLFLKTPSMRYDGKKDFATWQKESREKLSELLGFTYMSVCEDEFHIDKTNEKDGYDEIHFTFQSELGYFVPCCYLRPKNADNMKAVICLQGHSTGMHVSYGEPKFPIDPDLIAGGDRDFALRAVKEGYAAFCVEQRYMGACGSSDEGTPLCNKQGALPALLLGRCAIGERVWDIMRLIDVIVKYFGEINSERISCLGNSGGGTATFYAACMDERICCAVPSCAVCTFKDSIVPIHHCPCNYIPGIARYFDMGDLGGLIAPRALVVVHGKEDDIFPEHGVKEAFSEMERLYDIAGANGKCALVTGDGGHRFYADKAWKVIHAITD